jgi:hypothetical protein
MLFGFLISLGGAIVMVWRKCGMSKVEGGWLFEGSEGLGAIYVSRYGRLINHQQQ